MRPGTVFCILCQGIVAYKKGDTKRFDDHMNIEHGAYHNLKYILAGCLMNVEERNIVAEIVEERQKDSDAGEGKGANVEQISILDKAFPLGKDQLDASPEIVLPKSELVSITEEEEKKISCPLCEARFGANSNLNRHLARFHKLSKEERDVVNESRRTSTQNKESFQELAEMSVSEGDITKEVSATLNVKEECNVNQCGLCDATFTRSSNLRRHMSRQHSEKNEMEDEQDLVIDLKNSSPLKKVESIVFTCDLCEYSCTKESSLKIHKTMKHKAKEKFEEKLLISRSLFKKNTKTTEDKKKYECSKCDFTGKSDKDLRYHRFQNHRHENIKKQVKSEIEHVEDNEMFLVEDSLNSFNVSLDLNDTVASGDEDNESGSVTNTLDSSKSAGHKVISKEQQKHFSEKKAKIIEMSEYFRSFPGNLLAWNGGEQELSVMESLPNGFGVKNSVSRGGRKYDVYVTPNRVFKLRSQISVLEFMKSCGEYSSEEIQAFEVKLKAKSL